MKKGYRIQITLLLLALMSVFLIGCGKKNAGNNAGSGDVSRAEYVHMLAQKFGFHEPEAQDAFFSDVKPGDDYYDEIQSLAEWDVIDSTGDFEPKKDATLGFAIESVIRALETRSLSDAGNTAEEMAQFYASNIAQIDISDLDQSVDADIAEAIIQYANEYSDTIEIPQVCELTLIEDTKEAAAGEIAFSVDGKTGMFKAGAENKYSVGDKVYVPAEGESIAKGIRISDIDGKTFTYTGLELEDVFSEATIKGTYEATVVDVILPTDSRYDGTGFTLAMDDPFDSVLASIDGHEFETYIYEYEDGFPAEGCTGSSNGSAGSTNRSAGSAAGGASITPHINGDSVGYDIAYKGFTTFVGIDHIKVNADYDFGWFCSLNSAYANIQFNPTIRTESHDKVAWTIPLGKVVVNCGPTPFCVEFELEANIGIEGDLVIEYSSHVTANANYRKGNGFDYSIDNTDRKLTVDAKVTVTAELTAIASLSCLGFNCINAEVTSGLAGIATLEADILDDDVPTCVDLLVFVPLRWGINQRDCLLTKINGDWKYSQTIWDSENSPVKMHWHWENGTLVEECTRGKGKEVVTPDVDEDGEPYEEYDYFDFEVIEFERIKVKSYSLFVDPGKQAKIEFEHLPEGLNVSDLTFTPENPDICSIDSNGNVTGKNGGSTMVIIKSKDGGYSAFVSVTVNHDYSLDNGGFDSL